MTDRSCIRGCVQVGIHYATCQHSGPDYTGQFPCRGCAPRECRDGSLICDKCFGRMTWILDNLRDLHGRLTAKADPLTATPLDNIRIRTTTTDLPAAQDADILDALHAVQAALYWTTTDLRTVTNDRNIIIALGELLLDRHKPVNGIRDAWSVQDAIDTWGIERKADTYVYPEADNDETEPAPVTEWYDPLLTVRQAAHRHKVTERAVQLWIQKGYLVVTARARGPRGSVLSYVRASETDLAATEATRRNQSRQFASRAID